MRAIKCYLSYTPRLYRWLVLVIFPIALLALGIMMSVNDMTTLALLGLLCTEAAYEIFADSWMLGGIQAKDYTGLSMVQASGAGVKYMKNVVLIDCIRRYVYMALISLSYIAVSVGRSGSLLGINDIIFAWNIYWLAGAVVSLVIWLSRFFSSMVAGFLFCYLTGFAYSFIAAAINCAKWGTVLCPLLAVVFSAISVRTGCKKMEGCYYDK